MYSIERRTITAANTFIVKQLLCLKYFANNCPGYTTCICISRPSHHCKLLSCEYQHN